MSVDHERPLPIAPERLDYFTDLLHPSCSKFEDVAYEDRTPILSAALLAEQVELQTQTNFYLQEAYDILNARFR